MRVELGTGVRSILRNGAYLFGTNLWTFVLRAIYLVFLTRFLGPENYAVWAYASAAYLLAMMGAACGLEMLFSVRIGLRGTRAPRVLKAGLTLRLILLGLASVILAAYALGAEEAGMIRTAVLLAIPALWGRGVAVWARAVLTGAERADISFRAGLILRAAEVVAGIAALYMGAGVLVLLAIHSLSWLGEAVVLLRRMKAAGYVPGLTWRRRLLVRLFLSGAVLGLGIVLVTWLSAGPILMARRLVSDLGELGQIAIAFQMAGLLSGLVQPFLNAALPVLFRSVRAGDARAKSFGPLVAVGALVLCGVGAVVAYLIGTWLIVLVFGEAYRDAGGMLAPAVLVAGLMIAPQGFSHLLVVRERRWRIVIANGIAAVVLAAGIAPALAAFGPVGILGAAALAWAVRLGLLIALSRGTGEGSNP